MYRYGDMQTRRKRSIYFQRKQSEKMSNKSVPSFMYNITFPSAEKNTNRMFLNIFTSATRSGYLKTHCMFFTY